MHYLIAIILALGAFSGVVLQGELMKAPLMLGVGLVGISGLIFLVSMATDKRGTPGASAPLPKQVWAVWFACAGGLFLAWAVSTSIYNYRIGVAEAYVARAVVVLEAIKAHDHAYPATLPISQLGEPPSLLRGPNAYALDGNEYKFTFFEPQGLVGDFLNCEYYEYRSDNPKWIHCRI